VGLSMYVYVSMCVCVSQCDQIDYFSVTVVCILSASDG